MLGSYQSYSLAPGLGRGLQHGTRHPAQDVDFLLGRLGAVAELVQARQQLPGCGRIEETDRDQRLLPMREQAGDQGYLGGVWAPTRAFEESDVIQA